MLTFLSIEPADIAGCSTLYVASAVHSSEMPP
jgi:hypothetical protein